MIVSSQITENLEQADGRRAIHEVHIDSDGTQFTCDYLASADSDIEAHLAATAASLNEDM